MIYLWIPITLVAALAQTARNATQRSLTQAIGVIGATQVRFLYGFPFALLFLAMVSLWLERAPPVPSHTVLLYALGGAIAQIAATALMLAAMRSRSFAIVTAYTKTEPVQVAVFATLLLGDVLTWPKMLAILIATAGVILTGWKPGTKLKSDDTSPAGSALALGLAAAAGFAFAAVFFRGAILNLPLDHSFVMRATTILALGLGLQSLMLIVYLMIFDRKALTGSFAAWKPSIQAGFLGAFASQFWFLGFALTSAANVRTLALVEVILAQIVSRRLFNEELSWREIIGMVLILVGVGALLWVAL
jgi:drug/metabolite transporter (DMT)-like permease